LSISDLFTINSSSGTILFSGNYHSGQICISSCLIPRYLGLLWIEGNFGGKKE
jgi:hypothetical protein